MQTIEQRTEADFRKVVMGKNRADLIQWMEKINPYLYESDMEDFRNLKEESEQGIEYRTLNFIAHHFADNMKGDLVIEDLMEDEEDYLKVATEFVKELNNK